jgi:hypothetical protein
VSDGSFRASRQDALSSIFICLPLPIRLKPASSIFALGARIEVPDPLIPGSVIAFQIITSDRKVVDARARVIYVQARQDAFFWAGVQFLSLGEDARTLIAREIAHAQGRKPVSEVIYDSHSQPHQN